MRNLKRVLSMALASIMVLGMMVIGAGAASTYENFTDKDEIQNQEAVNTMVSLGVLNGKEDGSYFDPTGIVTRGEMAKIIAVMLNGGKDPVLTDNATTTFSDTKGNWAEAYIAFAVNQKILAGRGDGSFAPNDPVTGSAFAKAVLCALGYRADLEGFVNSSVWDTNVDVLANKVGLYDGLETIKSSEGLSRDNVAQLIYNAVQAKEVKYNNLYGDHSDVIQAVEQKTMLESRFGVIKVEGVVVANNIMDIDDNGTTVKGKARLTDIEQGGVKYVDKDDKILNAIYPVSLDNSYLGRRVVLYVKGLKDLSPNASDMTIVGEPIISNKNIIAETADRLKDDSAVKSFLSKNELSLPDNVKDTGTNGTVAYTAKDTVRDITVPSRAFAVTDAKAAGTELTFIDHDGDGTVDYIFRTIPTLAKVTVYNDTDSKMTIAGHGSVNFSDIANEEDVAKDDIILYYKVNDTYYLQKAETVSGQVTSYNNADKNVTMDGEKYLLSTAIADTTSTDLIDFAATMELVNGTYTFYLDAHGNVIAYLVGEENVGNYALILASEKGGSSLLQTGKVKLLMQDGTVGTYDVNLLASANKFGRTGSTSQKEAWMANELDSSSDSGMANILVSYVLDEAKKNVTIGNPAVASKSTLATITVGENGVTVPNAATYPVTRTTSRYVFGGTNGRSIAVNDSTLFFIRNVTGSASRAAAGDTYSVVKGLSNLPTKTILKSDNTNATVEGAVYSITKTNPNVAKAVFVDGEFKGTSNYVYLTSSYEGTELVNGQRVYAYPAVYEDGKKDVIKTTDNSLDDDMVYEYTINSDGYADLELTGDTYNGYVTTYTKGSNLSVRLGKDYNGATTSFTLATKADVWNVEGSEPYEETLSENMSVRFVTDSDGFVKTVFVTDSNVTHATIDVSKVEKLGLAKDDNGNTINNVFSGYSAQLTGFKANADVTVNYSVKYSSGRLDASVNMKNATSDDKGVVKLSVPKDASLITINSASPLVGSNETPSDGKWTVTVPNVYLSSPWSVYVDGKTPEYETGIGYKTVKVADGAKLSITNTGWGAGESFIIDGKVLTANDYNVVELTVNKDVILPANASDISKVYGIHVGDDVTVTKLVDDASGEVQAVDVIDGVIYVKASDNVKNITAYTTDANGLLLTNGTTLKGGTSGDTKSIAVATTKGEAAAKSLTLNSAVIPGDVYLYAASTVTFSATGLTVKVGTDSLATGDYVKVGETVVSTIATPATNGTGVIATTGTKTAKVGPSVANGYVVTEENVTLNVAFQVNLVGITSVTTANSETVKSGDFVVKDEAITYNSDITYDTGSPAHMINTTDAKFTKTALSANVPITKDTELSAATELSLTDSKNVTVSYESEISGSKVDMATSGSSVKLYVLPGTVVQVTVGTGETVKVTATDGTSAVPELTRDDPAAWAEFTVTSVDLTLSDNA